MSTALHQAILGRALTIRTSPQPTGFNGLNEELAVKGWLAAYNEAAERYQEPRLECIGGVSDPHGYRPEGVLAFLRSVDENLDGTHVGLVLYTVHDRSVHCQVMRGFGSRASWVPSGDDARCHPIVACRELRLMEYSYFASLPHRVTEIAAYSVVFSAECMQDELHTSAELTLNRQLAETWLKRYNELEPGLHKPLVISGLAMRDEDQWELAGRDETDCDSRPIALVSSEGHNAFVLKRSLPYEDDDWLQVSMDGRLETASIRGYKFVDMDGCELSSDQEPPVYTSGSGRVVRRARKSPPQS